MKKLFMISVCIMVIVLMSGCGTTSGLSKNYQRSLARSSGDITATVVLEQSKVDQAKMLEVIAIIEKYLNNTTLDNMTALDLQNALVAAIPYQNLKNIAVSITNKIPADMSVKDAKKIILAYMVGMKSGTNEFDITEK